jgi:hypothetical protein
VKVVEGSWIYNFPIHHILHFYSKIWRKSISNRASLKSGRLSRDRPRRRAPAPPRARPPPSRRPCRLTPSRGPPSRLPNTAPRHVPRPDPRWPSPLRTAGQAVVVRPHAYQGPLPCRSTGPQPACPCCIYRPVAPAHAPPPPCAPDCLEQPRSSTVRRSSAGSPRRSAPPIPSFASTQANRAARSLPLSALAGNRQPRRPPLPGLRRARPVGCS